MERFTTKQALELLGISKMTLYRAIKSKRITPPAIQGFGGMKVRIWTRRDVERVRKQLKRN